MIKYYNNVYDLMEFNKPKTKISLNDIYAQVYNVNDTKAIKMANDFVYGKRVEKVYVQEDDEE